MKVVTIDYDDLVQNKDISAQIKDAFGPESLGLCLVSNLPNEYLFQRAELLRLASVFASLPEKVKQKTVHEASCYSFGWSHGKEKMNGRLDLSKGSFYNNPVIDEPEKCADPVYQQQFPQYAHPNIWPDEDLPELKPAFMTLGKFVVDVGTMLARQFDKYISEQHFLPPNFLQSAITQSQTHKARLLHYFPMDKQHADEAIDSWCGLHVDHSLLTGLTSAMFLDEVEGSYDELDKKSSSMQNLLKSAGLHVKMGNEYVRVAIPTNCLAFQLGEAAQIASRNLLRATPHLVKGVPELARNTFAVFMQPNVDYELRENYYFSDFTADVMKRHYA